MRFNSFNTEVVVYFLQFLFITVSFLGFQMDVLWLNVTKYLNQLDTSLCSDLCLSREFQRV